MAAKTVPVTLVSGFLGAGKSTLISHLKESLKARRPAFLVRDTEHDFFADIQEAVNLRGADLVVVECNCDDEPYLGAELLTLGTDQEPPPQGIRLDTLVTIVDASRFMRDILSPEDLVEVYDSCREDDDRTVSEILVEQVEFADVIIVNKVDLVDAEELSRVEALIERLNPRARVIGTSLGKVAVDEIVGTGLFDMDETDDGAGWLAELSGDFDAVGEIEGVSSFTYVNRHPLHPIRFNELLGDFNVKGLVRAKGSIWVATRHHEIGVWSLAGRASVLSYGGAWFAATPAREWPQDERERAEIMQDWVPPFGDRRQEIAFIGIDMDEREIRDRLDECLLTNKEMKDGPDSWFSIPDPLPDWHVDADADY